MIESICRCDVCRKQLETEVRQTPFGEINVIKGLGKTKEINTDALFQHLCIECALSIDNAILKEKMRLLSMESESKKHNKRGK
jgi:hypothetical protein